MQEPHDRGTLLLTKTCYVYAYSIKNLMQSIGISEMYMYVTGILFRYMFLRRVCRLLYYMVCYYPERIHDDMY